MARCKGVKADGTPCRAPAHFVSDSGYCDSHDPEKREEMRERALKGGDATKSKRKRRTDLLADLPALDTVDSVREWLHRVGQAAALGDIDYRQAQAVLKAAEIGMKALQTASQEEIASLRDELQRVAKIRRIK